MSLRECPSCALESDASETVCPFCGYEFPETSKGIAWAAGLFALLLLIWPVFRLIKLLF